MTREHRLLILALIIFLLAGTAIGYSQTPPGPNTIRHDEGLNLPTITATDGYFYGAVNVTNSLFGDFTGLPLTGTTLDTGQGAYELYAMDQNVLISSDVNFSSLEADDLYVRDNYNVTQLAMYPQQPASYIIWTDGTAYYAKDGTTGAIDFSGADAATVIQAAIDALPNGGKISIKAGNYLISSTIDINAAINIVGEGVASTIFTMNADTNVPMFSYFATSNKQLVTLQKIKIDGSSNDADAIIVNGYFKDFRLYETWIKSWLGYALNVTESIHDLRISNNAFEVLGGGVRLNGATISVIERNMFYDITHGTDNIAIKIEGGWGNIIASNSIRKTGSHGISLPSSTPQETDIINNFIEDFGNDGASSGIYLVALRIKVLGNTIDTPIGCTSIREVGGSDYNIIKNNILETTPSIVNVGSNTIIINNIGFVTENSGTATLLNGNTAIIVNHGCDYTPSAGDIQVHPIETLNNAAFWWVDTITATQFTINVDQDPGADVDFAWSVDRH